MKILDGRGCGIGVLIGDDGIPFGQASMTVFVDPDIQQSRLLVRLNGACLAKVLSKFMFRRVKRQASDVDSVACRHLFDFCETLG